MPQSLRDRRPQRILFFLLLVLFCLTLGSFLTYRSVLSELSLASAGLLQREERTSAALREHLRRDALLSQQKERYEKLVVLWNSFGALTDIVPLLSQYFGDDVTLHHMKSDGEVVTLSIWSQSERSVSEFLERLRLIKGFYFDRSARRDPAARSGSLHIITGKRLAQ